MNSKFVLLNDDTLIPIDSIKSVIRSTDYNSNKREYEHSLFVTAVDNNFSFKFTKREDRDAHFNRIVFTLTRSDSDQEKKPVNIMLFPPIIENTDIVVKDI